MKKFHIGDILSVITGKMVSIRSVEGLYDILNYMSDDNLHTHQLPRVMDECKPCLIQQFPQLEYIDVSDVNEENFPAFTERIEEEYGRYLEVDALPEGVHKRINPIAEAFMIDEKRE